MQLPRRLGLCLLMLSLGIVSKAQQPELVIQAAHSGDVQAVAFSPDGKLLATAGSDHTIKLWHTATGKELHTLLGHSQPISTLAFSHDGKTLASGGYDARVMLWDVATGKSQPPLLFDCGQLKVMRFGPDDRTLIVGCDKKLHIWKRDMAASRDSFQVRKDLTIACDPVNIHTLAVRPKEKKLAVVSGKNPTIKILDLLTGKEEHGLTGHTQRVTSVAYSPDSKLLASGSEDRTIKLWKAMSTESHLTLTGHTGAVTAVGFSSDGKHVLSGSEDRSVRIWDVETGKELGRLKDAGHPVQALAVHPRSPILATAGKISGARLWQIDTAKNTLLALHDLSGRLDKVYSVAVAPDGRTLAVGAGHVGVLWHPGSDRQLQFLKKPRDKSVKSGEKIDVVAFSSDGKLLVSSDGGSKDPRINLWDASTGNFQGQFPHLHTLEISALALSPDGKQLASGGWDRGQLHLWDVGMKTKSRSLPIQNDRVFALAFSPNGKTLASACGDGTTTHLRLWDPVSGKEVQRFKPHGGTVFALAFSANGRLLATAGSNPAIHIWDTETGKQLHELGQHGKAVYALAFVPDSNSSVLASGGGDGNIRLWNAATGKKLGEPGHHGQTIRALAFANKGQFLYSASGDGVLSNIDYGDGSIKLREFKDGVLASPELGTLYSFSDGTWAVIEPGGRYDGSYAGDVDWLHWNIHNEPVALNQLKEGYYEPQLLAKLLGINKETKREVAALENVRLFPHAEIKTLDAKKKKLTLELTDQGGGIGRVQVFVNGKEVRSISAKEAGIGPKTASKEITIDLANVPTLRGKKNELRIVTWNAADQLSSRGLVRELEADAAAPPPAQPELYAIVAGISHYKGPRLNLNYAAKDAEDFARALTLGGKRFFGADKVHLTLLTTTNHPSAVQPTKENLRKAFEAARRAKPNDIFVVFLAGHGVALTDKDQKDRYCYLTQDATALDTKTYADEKIREATAVSSEELVQWINQVPALRQVMVLDTCAAGAATEKLLERRDVPGSQVRAIEKLKDRTGFHVLMGCAADRVSYEATRYQQGLLTYAVLDGMRGEALDSKEQLDVTRLFQHAARRVPDLAQDIGGIQQPVISSPRGQAFPLGQFAKEDRDAIKLPSPKPIVLLPLLSNPAAGYADDLFLADLLRKRLTERSAANGPATKHALVYVDVADMRDAYRPTGSYTVTGKAIKVQLVLRRDGQTVATLPSIEGTRDDLAGLVDKLATAIMNAVLKK